MNGRVMERSGMYRVCLDNCCNSRLFDGGTSLKVKAQAEQKHNGGKSYRSYRL